MKPLQFKITGKVWLYAGDTTSWHFFTIPKKETLKIKETYGAQKRGWGSLPVEVQIGTTMWRTSIFPDTKSGTYLLPIKALIRRKEDIEAGDTAIITLNLCP